MEEKINSELLISNQVNAVMPSMNLVNPTFGMNESLQPHANNNPNANLMVQGHQFHQLIPTNNLQHLNNAHHLHSNSNNSEYILSKSMPSTPTHFRQQSTNMQPHRQTSLVNGNYNCILSDHLTTPSTPILANAAQQGKKFNNTYYD